jgi:hypothetical protein
VSSSSKSPSSASAAVAAAFERRAARAELLARESPTAREPLAFARGLYLVQGALAAAVERAHAARPLAGSPERDLGGRGLGKELAALLHFAAEHGPEALARQARERAAEDPLPPLGRFWRGDGSGRGDYLSRALLRPYTEALAAVGVRPDRPGAPAGCPVCAGPAWIAARRPAAEGEGAQRFLGCALCGGEWPVNRIRCPACGEESPDKLPSFQSERHPAVRIEACATCSVYVKSIDLTLDRRAIPEVDELLSLSMDLWASEQGYTRLEPGLAGI